ncbi:MAG: GNAT family N-acetyltransferase [Herminiimonas sp.]|nr:GNAT family N-acetyltransferase [Herminiimonas sp.]
MDNAGFSARIATPATLSAVEISVWETLCATVPHLFSPFLSFHYAHAVAECGVDVRVCILSKNGEICGFLPYQFGSRIAVWSGVAEPVGAGMTDYFGLIGAADLRISSKQLLHHANIRYLGFSHLDEPQLGYGLRGEQPRTGLRIRLSPDAVCPLEAVLKLKQKYRKNSERCAKLLASEIGPTEFILDVQDQRKSGIDNLIRQKRAQYERTNVPDSLGHAWTRALLHKLSNSRSASCRGMLSTLTADGQWVASHFGIVGNGVLQYWFPVYNQEFAKYAPGRLLIHQVIESSREASIHLVDRGEGDTPSKRVLANEEHQFLRGVWHDDSFMSYASRGFHSVKWRLKK